MIASASSGDEDAEVPEVNEDVRDFRARLVAQEKGLLGEETSSSDAEGASGWMYETPLIEKGAVLLGGTKQDFGFGLRQQYFHKCALLLVEHDDRFTKGIILNRPTSLKLKGWNLWCGGDVQEGGLFRKGARNDQSGSLPPELTCLHRLESEEARAVSSQIIKSIYQTSFENALQLVDSGKATRDDFWLFAGYCGWAPNQLQGELERNSWYMAAADSSVLLGELLAQSSDPMSLPRLAPDSGLEPGGDGIATWARLMRNIGKGAEELEGSGPAERSLVFEDRMLREWVRQRLTDFRPAPPEGEAETRVVPGTLLASELWPGFILEQQFLHKSLILVLDSNPQLTLGVILNRPTAAVARVALEDADASDQMSRLIRFGGDVSSEGQDVYLCLLPQEDAPDDAVPIGMSGICRLGESTPAAHHCRRMQIVQGFVFWKGGELQDQIKEGRFSVVQPEDVSWDELWELGSSEAQTGVAAESWTMKSLGAKIWEGSRQKRPVRVPNEGSATPGIDLADLALLEWAKYFLQ